MQTGPLKNQNISKHEPEQERKIERRHTKIDSTQQANKAGPG